MHKNKIKSIIDGFVHFIKEGYFDIIKYFYQSESFSTYYETNLDILTDQVETEKKTFWNMIDIIRQFKTQVFYINNNEHLLKCDASFFLGLPNYEMRQKEKLKQIKIQIAVGGDLKDEIDQDY